MVESKIWLNLTRFSVIILFSRGASVDLTSERHGYNVSNKCFRSYVSSYVFFVRVQSGVSADPSEERHGSTPGDSASTVMDPCMRAAGVAAPSILSSISNTTTTNFFIKVCDDLGINFLFVEGITTTNLLINVMTSSSR